ncbi:MAG: hypothetical protein GXP42_19590 [Chloroflexi bacterium]|nr:hypothetical protein [Chloroflexota bacterium]
MSQRYIFRFWLPLAIMWLMMAIEQPILAALIARLDEPKLNLAAFGITFSLALLIESPIIMLLVAGTALAKGRQSYGQLIRFTTLLSMALTALHLLIVITPLFGLFVGKVIAAPPALVEPARRAFFWMLPWTAAIAYRRLWQGVMIRYGKTDQVSITTVVRLIFTVGVAGVGLIWRGLPGASLAAAALSVGVIAGAVSARIYVAPILSDQLALAEAEMDRIGMRSLLVFYAPLAMTNIINFISRPLLTLGLSRGLAPLESLALWPVLMSLAFLFRSIGFAYQEVVVALFKDKQSMAALRRFAISAGLALSALLILLAVTPLNHFWYARISGLTPDLVDLARAPTLIIGLAPAAAFITAWLRGALVTWRRTPPITAAVIVNVMVLTVVMWAGIQWLAIPGVNIAALAFALAVMAETIFLGFQVRSRQDMLMKPGGTSPSL